MPPIHGAARPPQRTSQQEGTMNTSTHPLGTLIETDVLVIGSGASGTPRHGRLRSLAAQSFSAALPREKQGGCRVPCYTKS